MSDDPVVEKSKKRCRTKPDKPSEDFPLTAHASGKWCKRIEGKMRYFGRWENPAGALREYLAAIGEIKTGTSPDILSLADGCNLFLAAKKDAQSSGEISIRTYNEYRATCKQVLLFFGRDVRADSFTPAMFNAYKAERSSVRNVVSMGNEIVRIRSVFRWLSGNKYLIETPEFGTEFNRSSRKVLKRHKRVGPKKLYSNREIRGLLDCSGKQMKAMILLGINCAFGPTDIARLSFEDIDPDEEFLEYARTKNENERQAWLWPETREAIIEAIEIRAEPISEECENLVFLDAKGKSFDDQGQRISKRFRQIREWAGIGAGGFYWMRHTFETVAGDSADQVAVDKVMGHSDQTMADNYRHGIDADRIKLVCNHVREWLFSDDEEE